MAYYVIEVQVSETEWKRVGHRYRLKGVAKTWLSFVKAAWHGRPVRVTKVQP